MGQYAWCIKIRSTSNNYIYMYEINMSCLYNAIFSNPFCGPYLVKIFLCLYISLATYMYKWNQLPIETTSLQLTLPTSLWQYFGSVSFKSLPCGWLFRQILHGSPQYHQKVTQYRPWSLLILLYSLLTNLYSWCIELRKALLNKSRINNFHSHK